MHLPVHLDLAQQPPRVRWTMAIAWLLIVIKCWLIWWAIGHWHMPFHPMWIVGPTVFFAGFATTLWLTHHEE